MNWHQIPNSLSGGVAVAYFAYALLAGVPHEQIVDHSIAGVAALVVLFVAASTGSIAPGVAKLLAAAFLWFGFETGFEFMLLSFLPCAIAGYIIRWRRGYEVPMPFLPFAAVAALLIVGGPHLLTTLAG